MGANTHYDYISSRGGGSSLTSAGNYFLCHPEVSTTRQHSVILNLFQNLIKKRSRNKCGMTELSCHCEVPKARQHERQYSSALPCHCEAERSEAVAIAKSLELNEITTSCATPRNDMCHRDVLAEGSQDNPPTLALPLKGGREKFVSEAHSKELNVLTSYRLNDFKKKAAFTLAEVLITLAIIGVVAAMTIPTLIANYQSKAWNTSAQVFERKLEEALKTMNTQQSLAGYSNTADFVAALGKHFKITRVCQNDDIMSCFEDKVIWGNEEVDMTKIKNASNFGQDDWDTELIGVQFANGTTGIIAYNPECKENPYTNQFTGTSCLAILYDTTGFKTPNTQQKDLRGINIISLGGNNCAIELTDGTCFTAPFKPEPLTKAECEQLKDKLGIEKCYIDNDYWAGAVKACGGVSKMPNKAQLTTLAKEMKDTFINSSGSWDKDKLDEIGFETSSNYIYVWSSIEAPTALRNQTYYIQFTPVSRGWLLGYRVNSSPQAICLGD